MSRLPEYVYTPFGAYGPTPEEADQWYWTFLVVGFILGAVVRGWFN